MQAFNRLMDRLALVKADTKSLIYVTMAIRPGFDPHRVLSFTSNMQIDNSYYSPQTEVHHIHQFQGCVSALSDYVQHSLSILQDGTPQMNNKINGNKQLF